jgi:hypothetical protein
MRIDQFNSRASLFALMFLLFVLHSSKSEAQSTSEIKGVVQNNSNEPLPGVSVIVRNTKTNFKKADFLKVVAYNICGGERYANFIRNIGSTIFRDVPGEELMRFNNHLLNYGNEAPLDQLSTAGLSPDYVFRETQRALAGVKGKCLILPGIDIGIPTKATSRKSSPPDTYAATLAAYKAGAHGVILSRKYSEMNLVDLDAAGRAIREGVKLKT